MEIKTVPDILFSNVFPDWDEDQSSGVQAPGGETEDAAETRCRCWESKNWNWKRVNTTSISKTQFNVWLQFVAYEKKHIDVINSGLCMVAMS